MLSHPPITATVTAYDRIDQAIDTVNRLQACTPPPDEIIVHVDAGRLDCASAIRTSFPRLTVLISEDGIGPGGARNRLMRAARNDLVATFDDDFYPFDTDFFARAAELFCRFPDVSLFAARVFHPGETVEPATREVRLTGSFSGCGVVFRRMDLIEAGSYLPLPIAYGAEEEDMALRLFDRGRILMRTAWLRVFHDLRLSHHGRAEINAQTLANIGLVAFLRYPPMYWPFGLAQVGNRIRWCLNVGRTKGLISGLTLMPLLAWRFRGMRTPVGREAIRRKRSADLAPATIF